jgi:hypothetical protein
LVAAADFDRVPDTVAIRCFRKAISVIVKKTLILNIDVGFMMSSLGNE